MQTELEKKTFWAAVLIFFALKVGKNSTAVLDYNKIKYCGQTKNSQVGTMKFIMPKTLRVAGKVNFENTSNRLDAFSLPEYIGSAYNE